MHVSRKQRIALGTVCIVVAALVMGWFIGNYIPGTPRAPEPQLGEGLYSETGRPTNAVKNFEAGSTLPLHDITQGDAYRGRPQEMEMTPQELVTFYKENGTWEYISPEIDLSVAEIKTLHTRSFAEWYPEYAGTYRPVYDDSKLIAVTVSITNRSDELITKWYELPIEHVTLWSENLGYIDDSLGAGAILDDAFVFANGVYNRENLIHIEPGESQQLILPFKVNKNALIDQGTFDDLDPADFCLQFVDFKSGTAYRLWL